MKFGLNVRKQAKPRPMFSRSNAFDRSDDEGEDEVQQQNDGSSKKQQQHRSNVNQQLTQSSRMTKKVAEQHAKALEEDAHIFDYDAVYDDLKEAERLKKEAAKGPDTKKPKYMQNLLEMAEIRKKDRLMAEEKKIAREREAEGEMYADKEVFMTEAFKKQKEELKRIEEEERKREEEANKKKKMTSFYKTLLDKKSEERMALLQQHENQKGNKATTSAAAAADSASSKKVVLDIELAKQAEREGKSVMLNASNEIVDRRQLLNAGLNVKPKFGSLGSLADERAQERQREYDEYKRKKIEEYERKRRGGGDSSERERYSREIEQQMLETREKEKKAEEEKQKELAEKATAKRTTEDAAMSARERYLARKKQKLEQEQGDQGK
ncbi:coiled-coil domain-containing protein 55-domain containing protein [Dichotomocladium elegans]|nr:coiled-coil domain-containing protein 55-domain containing protein [Dichotomocladium elegans]